MNPVREKALLLRLRGKSYNEITKELGVPKSTLSGWLKHVALSDAARERLTTRIYSEGAKTLVKRNKLQTKKAEQRAREMRLLGKGSVMKLVKHDLLLIGAVLYWAEGYKRLRVRDGKARMAHTISFVNADPVMIKTFLRFLREVLEIPPKDLHITMRLYPHINETVAQKYWMHITELPASQFHSTTNLVSSASKGVRPYNRLPHGTLQISVYDTAKFHYLLGLIEGVQIGL